MKEILLIFKTHLDIGFTDYAESVLQKYLEQYIPNAIRAGYELKDTETPFVWTVGSWLLWQALQNDKDKIVENAIKDGILRWHALPFTTHTELMNSTLFEYGVSLSKKLDERFGVKTVGAKMSDVPGHTIGMIPILKKYGVNFLHIGVNPATPLPPVPPVFKWKYRDDEITVMYQGNYGEVAEFDDFIVYFAHTGDNLGPQSAEDIIATYREIQERYPNCKIKASTIEELAERVSCMQGVPVIEKEIGDTWIHGVGTDPQKVSRYRKLLRNIEKIDKISFDLTDNLLCVPEHTWGMDVKTHFAFKQFYTHQELELFVNDERKKIEKSWKEQRDYVSKAEKLLNVQSDYPIKRPDLSTYVKVENIQEPNFEISWQLFDVLDYERYKKEYMRCHLNWAIWDFTKVGLEKYKGGIYTASVVDVYQNSTEVLYHYVFEKELAQEYGLPEFYLSIKDDKIELKWFNKKMSRLPQAFWFKIKGLEEDWQLQKMGVWISPEEIIGSPLISAIDKGVKNPSVEIESWDCALVAPFGRQLLQYNLKNCKQDLYFNLYNNIWNTNFPMWYSDDALFRFFLKKHIEQ